MIRRWRIDVKAEVTSSNTVGYMKLTLGAGFNWVAPQFLSVGEDPIHIQNLQLAFGENGATGGENIQILDAVGAVAEGENGPKQYYWATEADDLGFVGWANEDGDALADFTLDPGQSVLLDCDEGTVLTVYGEVATSDYVTTAVAGFNFIGNSTPDTINVQEITLDFGENEATGGENIQILDSVGAVAEGENGPKQYYWATEADDLGFVGWANEDGDALATFTLDPGQGILIDIGNAGTTITVPSAL